jgi:hypothetical protein
MYIRITRIRGMIKKFLARYTSSHYTDIYTRYVDTNILLKITDDTLISRGMCHLGQMEKVEIRAVIKYLCKKGMPPRKSMKTSCLHLGRSPLLIALWRNGLLNLKGTGIALEMMSGLDGQRTPPTMNLPKLCMIWSCARECLTCEALLGKWLKLGFSSGKSDWCLWHVKGVR